MNIEVKKAFPIANPVAVLREEFDDWAVVFNPDNAKAVGINPVDVITWKLLDGKHNLEEIAKQIQAKYKNVSSNVLAELESFVSQLEKHELIGYYK